MDRRSILTARTPNCRPTRWAFLRIELDKADSGVYNQTVAGLKFFYEATLNREGVMVGVR
jgi:hypothetical protein